MSDRKRRRESSTPSDSSEKNDSDVPDDDCISLKDSSVVALCEDSYLSMAGSTSVRCDDSSVVLSPASSAAESVSQSLVAERNDYLSSSSPSYSSTFNDGSRGCDAVVNESLVQPTPEGDIKQGEDFTMSSLLILDDTTGGFESHAPMDDSKFFDSFIEASGTAHVEPHNMDNTVTLEMSDDEEYEVSKYAVSSNDTSESEEEHEDFFPDSPDLYLNSPITVSDSMLAILAFVMRHNLSGTCISDLLKLISLHLPKEHKMGASLYFFKKHFSRLTVPVKYHYFCSHCNSSLSTTFECPHQNEHPQVTPGKNFFIEIPLITQLKLLYQRESFVSCLQHRFSRNKLHPSNIEDIYDGQLYKEQVESGFLSEENKYNFSLMWNSDGVPVFKSSQSSLWPVYFTINELPYNMRHKKENMLLGGIWFGKKPPGNVLLRPFISSFREIKEGFEVKLPNVDKEVKIKGILLCGTCDLPAKCMFMVMTQFNGAWGCHICKLKGESVVIEPPKKSTSKKGPEKELDLQRRNTVWVYKYTENIELRQHTETVLLGEQAHMLMMETKKEQNIFGVKGPSVLSKIMKDVIRGMAIDLMHSGFLGIVRKILDLLFNTKYKNEPWSLHGVMPILDKQLLKIRPPNFIDRGVRSLAQYTHWKASELKNWIFYYFIPVVEGYLPDPYMENFMNFIYSIYTLSGSSVTPEELLDCANRLDKFVCNFEALFGARHMNMNVHLMLHLSFVVNNLGPLWCYTCFPFENLNGLLLRMIHGTQGVETQLASCAYLVLNLPHELNSVSSQVVRDTCFAFLHPSLRLKKLEDIQPGIFSVGVYKVLSNVPDNVSRHVVQSTGMLAFKCQTFLRLKKDKLLFSSQCYTKSAKTVSYIVSFKDNLIRRFGSIVMFYRVSNCECLGSCLCTPAKFFALIEMFDVVPWSDQITHVYRYTMSGVSIVVPVQCLEVIHFDISVGNNKFLCEPVNFLESE